MWQACRHSAARNQPCFDYPVASIDAEGAKGFARRFLTGCPHPIYPFAAAPQTLEYFASLNIHIFEVFGQSECTGPMAVTTREAWKMGSCGRPMLVSGASAASPSKCV